MDALEAPELRLLPQLSALTPKTGLVVGVSTQHSSVARHF